MPNLKECFYLAVGLVVHQPNVGASLLKISPQNGLHQTMGCNLEGDGIWRNLLQSLVEEHGAAGVVGVIFGRTVESVLLVPLVFGNGGGDPRAF